MARDLKFIDAYHIPHWKTLIERRYSFLGCTRAAQTYQENVFNAHTITRLPGYAFMYGKLFRTAQYEVLPAIPEETRNSPEIIRRVWSRFFEQHAEEANEFSIMHAEDSTRRVEEVFSLVTPLSKALEGVLESVIIQIWRAFEVLAEDLWKRVVRRRPKLNNRTKQERHFSGHRSRTKIAKLYEYTFRHDNRAIMRAVDSKKIHGLAIARNVIVHSAGCIDEAFVKDRKDKGGITPLNCIRGKNLGYRIPFTGKIVRHLVDPVIPLGFDLVRAVDQWLLKN
jgi:hypothetical protein